MDLGKWLVSFAFVFCLVPLWSGAMEKGEDKKFDGGQAATKSLSVFGEFDRFRDLALSEREGTIEQFFSKNFDLGNERRDKLFVNWCEACCRKALGPWCQAQYVVREMICQQQGCGLVCELLQNADCKTLLVPASIAGVVDFLSEQAWLSELDKYAEGDVVVNLLGIRKIIKAWSDTIFISHAWSKPFGKGALLMQHNDVLSEYLYCCVNECRILSLDNVRKRFIGLAVQVLKIICVELPDCTSRKHSKYYVLPAHYIKSLYDGLCDECLKTEKSKNGPADKLDGNIGQKIEDKHTAAPVEREKLEAAKLFLENCMPIVSARKYSLKNGPDKDEKEIEENNECLKAKKGEKGLDDKDEKQAGNPAPAVILATSGLGFAIGLFQSLIQHIVPSMGRGRMALGVELALDATSCAPAIFSKKLDRKQRGLIALIGITSKVMGTLCGSMLKKGPE
ncbi:MAG: hypothetical protein M1549_03415 [Candidatus Dependentiae bacterium]|nr:hypothetical protein [Candidatus Dependentiae bacterium]